MKTGLLAAGYYWRRVIGELVGTGLLVAIVVGSGIAATNLSPGDKGLQLLQNSIATTLGLAALILVFQPLSGAHFNPVVTLADRALGSKQPITEMIGYMLAQIIGALGGAILANIMFNTPTTLATTHRITPGHFLAEIVATAGLLLVIFSLVRTNRSNIVAPTVGAYIGAAYWFTSSTSFANPAVTIGRTVSDTFAGIAPSSVLPFIAAQIIGATIGTLAILAFYPKNDSQTE